jgi:hypothetical protein
MAPSRLCLVVALASALAGCVSVRAGEKAALADPVMQPDRDPAERALDERVHACREGALGGLGPAKGASGCR